VHGPGAQLTGLYPEICIAVPVLVLSRPQLGSQQLGTSLRVLINLYAILQETPAPINDLCSRLYRHNLWLFALLSGKLDPRSKIAQKDFQSNLGSKSPKNFKNFKKNSILEIFLDPRSKIQDCSERLSEQSWLQTSQKFKNSKKQF
jgi:hypothetical protein